MEWTGEVVAEGYYWWTREATHPAELVSLTDYGDAGLHLLPFGKDLDEAVSLAEWLEWAPESRFWGPLPRPS